LDSKSNSHDSFLFLFGEVVQIVNSEIAENFEDYIAGFLLLIMVVVAFVNVVTRYLLHASLAFLEEIEVAFFVWVTFLGTAMAFKRRSHLAMTFFRDRTSKKVRKVLLLTGYGLSFILFVIVLYLSAQYVYLDMTLYHSRTMALGIPMWIYTIGMPLFSIIILLRVAQTMWRMRKDD